jgi:hypothetical protein
MKQEAKLTAFQCSLLGAIRDGVATRGARLVTPALAQLRDMGLIVCEPTRITLTNEGARALALVEGV